MRTHVHTQSLTSFGRTWCCSISPHTILLSCCIKTSFSLQLPLPLPTLICVLSLSCCGLITHMSTLLCVLSKPSFWCWLSIRSASLTLSCRCLTCTNALLHVLSISLSILIPDAHSRFNSFLMILDHAQMLVFFPPFGCGFQFSILTASSTFFSCCLTARTSHAEIHPGSCAAAPAVNFV